MRLRVRTVVAAVVLVLGVACGSSDPVTAPPPPAVPEVTCPQNVTVTGAASVGQAVSYDSPVTTGGTPPVSTTCSPASGAVFPVGTTTVGCTARDAISRSAVCSFTVTLTAPHLGAMRFVAFGDSITAGEDGINGDDLNPVNCGPTSSAAQAAARALPQVINVSQSYPSQLLGLLNARFVGEAFMMVNEGLRGELAEDGTGRLSPCVFQTDHPDVLLLLEGVNDLGGYNFEPTERQSQIVVDYLQTDVANALAHGVSYVFVSTITPVERCSDPGNCRIHDAVEPNAAIDQTNAILRGGVAGATVVDGNAAFRAADPTLASLISTDGLHPSSAGYTVLAQAVMNAIVNRIPISALRR